MLLRKFNDFLLSKELLQQDQNVLVAVSGGLDSIVLCRLFKESKIDFAIAHCNFKLRGKESDGDQEFVKKLAADYKVPFYSIQFKTKAFAKEKKLSTQEAARELRYQWFEKIRAEHQYDKIAVAHHLNDSIETFFINTIRGTRTCRNERHFSDQRTYYSSVAFCRKRRAGSICQKEKIEMARRQFE